MPKKLIVIVNAVDENGEMSLTKEISRKEITPPTDVSNFGYNRTEQLQIIAGVQQAMLDSQADFLKSETE